MTTSQHEAIINECKRQTMLSNKEDTFYCQLAKSIQAWLSVETEIYLLYSAMMKGANPHLVSVTFYNIQSFEAKIQLLNSCLTLFFTHECYEWKTWKNLLNQAEKLNGKRNKIVHEPVILSMKGGIESIALSPSHFNALTVAKGRTSHNGPTIGVNYDPRLAQVTKDHQLNMNDLYDIQKEFKTLSKKLLNYRKEITPLLETKFNAKDGTLAKTQ